MKNDTRYRPLRFEPLESRCLLDANWYQTTPIATVSANELELWDWINQFREDPSGALYRIFDHPENLYQFDSFNLTDPNTVRAARDINVDWAIKTYLIGNSTGEELKQKVDDFLNRWYSLSAVEPVALSMTISSAARAHNNLMIKRGTYSHQLNGEESLATRLVQSGTALADGTVPSEVITYGGKSARTDSETGDYFSVSSFLFASLAVDWGVKDASHRSCMIDENFSELGIAVSSSSPYTATVDFAATVSGARTDGAYLMGLVYNDATGDGIYTAGEGLSSGYSLTITSLEGDSCGESVTIDSILNGLAADGGYQIFLANGTYEIQISGGDFGEGYARQVQISDGENVKVDFRIQDLTVDSPVLDLNGDDEGIATEARFVEGSSSSVRLVSSPDFILTTGDPRPDATLTRLSVTMESRPDGADEMLGVTLPVNSTLRLSQNTVTGALDVFGSASVEEYRALIASLSYINLKSEGANLTERVITLSVYNGLSWSDPATVTLTLQPSDLPVLTIEDSSVWEWEASAADQANQRRLVFTAMLSEAARTDVTFLYRVNDGTARAGQNYRASDAAGEITIAAGQTSAQIQIAIYGNYEINDDLTLNLTILHIENAIWDDTRVVVGTIRDDDTPVVAITDGSWQNDRSASFERGARRYLYTFTSQTAGLARWSVGGTNLSISIYEGWHADNSAIQTSQWKNNRHTVEWSVAAGTVYYIELVGNFSYRNPVLTFVEMTEDNPLLVDPLLDDNGQLPVEIGGDQIRLGYGDDAWNLNLSQFGTAALKLYSTQDNASLALAFHSPYDLSYDSPSGTIQVGNASIQIAGFSEIDFSGSDYQDSLTVTASDGNDRLTYSDGAGSIVLYYDQPELTTTLLFSNLTTLLFDAGGGTGDEALLTDTSCRDHLTCHSLLSYTLSGGGHGLTVKNFNQVNYDSIHGGRDTMTIASVDWSEMVAQVGDVYFQGTVPQEATSNLLTNDLDTATSETTEDDFPVTYTCTVSGQRAITIDASSSNGVTNVTGMNRSHIRYQATLGYLRATDSAKGASLEITQVTDLELTGIEEEWGKQVVLLTADVTDFSGPQTTEKATVYTGYAYSRLLKLTLPVWATSLKNRDSQPEPEEDTSEASASLPVSPAATEAALANFVPETQEDWAFLFEDSSALTPPEQDDSFTVALPEILSSE